MNVHWVLRCAENAAQAIASGSANRDIVLTERLFGDVHPVKIVPGTVKNAVKADIIRSAYTAAKDYHEEIAQVQASLLEAEGVEVVGGYVDLNKYRWEE